jgi:hypothetical protein
MQKPETSKEQSLNENERLQKMVEERTIDL